jgi:hypothetical protein
MLKNGCGRRRHGALFLAVLQWASFKLAIRIIAHPTIGKDFLRKLKQMSSSPALMNAQSAKCSRNAGERLKDFGSGPKYRLLAAPLAKCFTFKF